MTNTKVCKQCGTDKPHTLEFWTPNNGGRLYGRVCRACRNANQRERNKTQPKRRKRKRKSKMPMNQRYFEVITDPEPLGGFSPGASFGIHDVGHMLSMGHFTLGTKLNYIDRRNRQGVYEVRADDRGRQKLWCSAAQRWTCLKFPVGRN